MSRHQGVTEFCPEENSRIGTRPESTNILLSRTVQYIVVLPVRIPIINSTRPSGTESINSTPRRALLVLLYITGACGKSTLRW